MSVTSFRLTAAANQLDAPWAFAMGFRRGDLPADVALDLPSYQVVVTCRWDDGSVKHALLAGRVASIFGGLPITVNVSAGTPPPGTALTAADIAAAAPTASVQCGALGTVSLSPLLASPFRTWISGPEMVEAHYRADVGGGTYLSVWFHVRLFRGGRVWIRAIAENGYLDNGAGALLTNTDQAYIPTVAVGGTTVYDNGGAALAHPKGTRWMAEGWIGSNPQIEVAESVEYLRATKLVPNYGWRSPSSATLNALAQTYTPQGVGSYNRHMEETGYQSHIAILPLWAALYAASGDPRARRAALANSSHLNSYAITWRDRGTKLPVKPSSFPTWSLSGPGGGGTVLIGAGSGDDARSWELNHMPGDGYLAYLITGDYWHYETMLLQLATCWLGIGRGPTGIGFRGDGTSRRMIAQTRGTAWCMRNMVQLAAIAPNGDTVAAEYRTLLANNVDQWKAVIDTPGINALGYIWEYSIDLYAPGTVAPWQQNFWIQSMGFGSDIAPLPNMANFRAVRDWMYRGIVGLLGGNGVDSFCFTKASYYTIKIADGGNNDPTSWYDTWGQVHTATFGADNITCGLVLEGTSGGDPTAAPTGYWGRLMPAIAYAVDHGAAGAATAYARLTSASNWNVIDNSGFDNTPIWGVVPRGESDPVPGDDDGWSILVDTDDWMGDGIVVHEGGLGILGADIPSTGHDGPSFLYNDLSLPADANVEIWAVIEQEPLLGTLRTQPDGSFSFTEAPDGLHRFTYRLYRAGVDLGSTTVTMIVGSAGPSDLSGDASLDGVSVAGVLSGGTPSTLSGAATLGGVDAVGTVDGGTPSDLSGTAALGSVTASGEIEGVGGAVFVFGRIERVAIDRKRLFAVPFGSYGPLRTVVDAKHAAEIVPVLVPFGAEVPAGVTIVSVARTCIVRRGADPDPNAILYRPAIVDMASSEVVQWIRGGLPQTRYLIVLTATLTNGAQLVRSIELPVIDFTGAGT